MRNRIGLFYINDPNWTGGQDYVINAVNSLTYLNELDQPNVDLIVDESIDLEDLKKKIEYKKYQFYIFKNKLNIWSRKIQQIQQMFRWKFVYPFPKASVYEKKLIGVSKSRRIYWIPDFQEEYYPEFFADDVILKRRKNRNWLAKQSRSCVVFSSESAKKDFIKFYGPDIIAQVKVLRFANPNKWEFSELNRAETLNKYGLEKDSYFICPNQFWKHKNHKLVIEAIRRISEKGNSICIVFCGKEQDPRDLDYFPELRTSAEDLVQANMIKFLGFLPKKDQMCLIAESKALIQPSLFEGWSTTIEDAISIGKLVLASDLDVNQEQLGTSGIYFKSSDVGDFVSKIELLNSKVETINYNNEKRIIAFARSISELKDA
jgi:glycosyltransferase involved in cell wall biosynthesis